MVCSALCTGAAQSQGTADCTADSAEGAASARAEAITDAAAAVSAKPAVDTEQDDTVRDIDGTAGQLPWRQRVRLQCNDAAEADAVHAALLGRLELERLARECRRCAASMWAR